VYAIKQDTNAGIISLGYLFIPIDNIFKGEPFSLKATLVRIKPLSTKNIKTAEDPEKKKPNGDS